VILRGDDRGATLLIDHLIEMRDGMLRLLVGEPIDGQFILGSGHAPSFEFGPGLPLFDYLVRDIPVNRFTELDPLLDAATLVSEMWIGNRCIRIDPPHPRGPVPLAFLHDDRVMMQRRLVEEAHQGMVRILGKPWPFVPNTEYITLRPDELGLWQFEPASCFAQFRNAVEHRLSDVRVVEAEKPHTDADRRSIPELMAAAYCAASSPPRWTAMQAMLKARELSPDAVAWRQAGADKRSAQRYWQKAREELDC
jgi:hypothetical protein